MKQGIIEDKEYKKDYEAGSGSLTIPILGYLFPKLFNQEMQAIDKWFAIIRIDSVHRYEVTKELYDKISIGDKVIINTDKFGMPEVKLVD